MPLKLNVGLSKKLGLPAYSSVGASCHLESELDSTVLQADAQRFHAEAQRLFGLCRQAVEEELARELPADHQPRSSANGHMLRTALLDEGSHDDALAGPCDAPGELEPPIEWGISERQLSFIQDLARQIQGLGIRRLPALVALQYDKNLTELSSVEASRLIGLLRQVRGGGLSLRTLLEDSESQT